MDLFQAFLIHAMVGRGLAVALITTLVVVVAVTVRNTVVQTRWALRAGGDLRQYRRAPVLTQAALGAARRARRAGLPSDEFYHLAREVEPAHGGMSFEEVYAEEHAAYYAQADEEEEELVDWCDHCGRHHGWLPPFCARCDKHHAYECEDYDYYEPVAPTSGKGWRFVECRELSYYDLYPEFEEDWYDDGGFHVEDEWPQTERHGRRRIRRVRRASKAAATVSVVSEPYRRYELLKERRCGKTTRRILARSA